MSSIFQKWNLSLREGSNIIDGTCKIRKRGKLLHVCINSKGCRFRTAGNCIMCNYGQGHSVTEHELDYAMQEVVKAASDVDSILFGTLGSIFDSGEFDRTYFSVICRYLKKLSVETIIFESHYSLIDLNLCHWLKDMMPGKDIVVEIGLESADSFVQKECLNKEIDLNKIKEVVGSLHSLGMSVTANVLLGSPFLSLSEQIDDTVNAVGWAMENGFDSVVIFPVNIRKNTLLEYLYNNDKYQRVYQWQVLEVLQKIPTSFLTRIYFSWYGDWLDIDGEGVAYNLPPISCAECYDDWMKLYKEFLNEKDGNERRGYIDDFLHCGKECQCHRAYLSAVKSYDGKTREERSQEVSKWLNNKQNLNNGVV